MMLMNGQEVEEMKEWKTLDTVVLEEDAKVITVKIPDYSGGERTTVMIA